MAGGNFRRAADLAAFFVRSKQSCDSAPLQLKWLGAASFRPFLPVVSRLFSFGTIFEYS